MIRTRLRRQLHRASFRSDGGFTLSELLVVIVLFSIIGGIVGTVVRVGLKHQTQMQDRNTAFANARKVIQRVDRDIRAAYPLDFASATLIRMDENDGTTTHTVTYSVVPTTAGQAKLTYNPGNGSATKVLITNLVQTATIPVFSFSPTTAYASSQTAAEAAVTTASTCALRATPTQYDPSCVGTISVHVLVQPATINQPVNVSDNGTDLRNAS